MPAFAKTDGGFLTDAQIASLAEYLDMAIPNKTRPPASHVGRTVEQEHVKE
jgi:hypothetical protein